MKQGLPPLKKILVIGNGGRENSLAWALAKNPEITNVFVSPGNGGTENQKGCHRLEGAHSNFKEIALKAKSLGVGLVIVGPEAPLAEGISDELRSYGLNVFGPCQEGSKLEASKNWAKLLMQEAGIPTARYWTANNEHEALSILKQVNKPLVVKADGLAAGKGVSVNDSLVSTENSIKAAFSGKFGSATNTLLLEEILEGPEVSVFALCDGTDFAILPTAQDHKRLLEGDKGPNTGGMGAYAPARLLDKKGLQVVIDEIIKPTIKGLKDRGISYRGVIYAGLMLTKDGPKVIEFNCRFGDPECQTLMPLLGPELAQVLQACSLGRLDLAPELTIKKGCSACVVAAAAGYPEAPRKGDLLDIKPQINDSVQIFHAGTRLNEDNKLVTSGGRVLSIVGEGDSFEEAFYNVYETINKISLKGIIYRKDIGHQVRKIN